MSKKEGFVIKFAFCVWFIPYHTYSHLRRQQPQFVILDALREVLFGDKCLIIWFWWNWSFLLKLLNQPISWHYTHRLLQHNTLSITTHSSLRKHYGNPTKYHLFNKSTPHTWNCEATKSNIFVSKIYVDGIGLHTIFSYANKLVRFKSCITIWFSCCGNLTSSINTFLVSLQNCSLLEKLDLSYNEFSGNNTYSHCRAMKEMTLFY